AASSSLHAMGRTRARRRSWTLSIVGLLLVAAACSGSDSSAGSRPSSTRERRALTSVPSAASAVRRRAIASYNDMWQDMAAAAATADYQSPRVAQHAAG